MRLAIIIPTLDEEARLTSLLPEVRREAEWIVVCDGGSGDRTASVASELGADLVESDPGRGVQLNRGASRALDLGAEALLFLHADTRLPRGAGDLVTSRLREGHVGGGFMVRFDDPRSIFRLGGRLVNARTRLTGLPLGDQAQFVRSSAFAGLGGFREWPVLEDLDFARRLRRSGRLALVEPPVVTSARRYVARGIARTVATNWAIWILFALGASPHRLGRWYGKGR